MERSYKLRPVKRHILYVPELQSETAFSFLLRSVLRTLRRAWDIAEEHLEQRRVRHTPLRKGKNLKAQCFFKDIFFERIMR